MNRTYLFLAAGACFCLSLFFLLASNTAKPTGKVNEVYMSGAQKDWNSCIQKENSEWGGRCLNYGFSEDMYSVKLINTCTEMVDLMCCIQRTNGQWRCFYRMDMGNTDTLAAYACKGSGKYLKWVRKAGDHTVRFPTLNEVNEQY